MSLVLVVAVDPNGVIGVNGTIPWRSKADLQRFKKNTTGGNLVMGRKTWESLGRPLPNRRHAVVTRNPEGCATRWAEFPDVKFYGSYQAALDSYGILSNVTFVIGGAEIYAAALANTDDLPYMGLDVTTIEEAVVVPEGATVARMPAIPFQEYTLIEELRNPDDPRLVHRTYVPNNAPRTG